MQSSSVKLINLIKKYISFYCTQQIKFIFRYYNVFEIEPALIKITLFNEN